MATILLRHVHAIKLSATDNQIGIPGATGQLWTVRLTRPKASASRRSFDVCLVIIRPCNHKWQAIYCSQCIKKSIMIKFSSQAVLSVAHHPPEIASIFWQFPDSDYACLLRRLDRRVRGGVLTLLCGHKY